MEQWERWKHIRIAQSGKLTVNLQIFAYKRSELWLILAIGTSYVLLDNIVNIPVGYTYLLSVIFSPLCVPLPDPFWCLCSYICIFISAACYCLFSCSVSLRHTHMNFWVDPGIVPAYGFIYCTCIFCLWIPMWYIVFFLCLFLISINKIIVKKNHACSVKMTSGYSKTYIHTGNLCLVWQLIAV